ncbi:MAG: amidohydrolase [Pseudomonadota bacterium]
MNSMAYGLILALMFSASTAVADTLPDGILSLYKDLHANPELSFQEKKTSARMAAELEALGFSVIRNIGGYGVAGVFEHGPGPTVLIRADMDALPVKEATGFAFASKQVADISPGQSVPVMHACGHDVHMANWVGTAKTLLARKDEWSGTLVFIAQPAEERGAGARAMLGDGLYKRVPLPDYNLALHVGASLPAGMVATTSGYALANVDTVDIYVKGVGGHGAYPHTTKDPIVLASKIVMALQTLVSRELSPLEPGVVTVGAFNAGSKHNVISDEAHLQLTVRSFSEEARALLLNGIKRIAHGEALAAGLPEDKLPKVDINEEHTPSVYNDPALTERVMAALVDTLGADNVISTAPVMGGEDFAEYGRTKEDIPGLIFWLGAVNPETFKSAKVAGTTLPSLHSPFFAPDYELTLKTGIKAMTTAALELLAKRGLAE